MPPIKTPSVPQLRRDAKRLRRAWDMGEPAARRRVEAVQAPDRRTELKHAAFLHIVARENGFESWPRLTWAAETVGLPRAARQRQLGQALAHGINWRVTALLQETPDLAHDLFGQSCAVYDRARVAVMLDEDPGRATRQCGRWRPIAHLAFSRYIHARPELVADMLAIAEMLLANGADVNDAITAEAAPGSPLSVLYGAIGHADNMALGRWLLEHGANPNDGEALYHATELGHHEGLRLLLSHGATPAGTNALLRALDFHDHGAVALLLEHGASADEFVPAGDGEEPAWVVPALHQAARRGCDRRMADLLLDAGADPLRPYQGASAWAYARVFGNRDVAEAIAGRTGTAALTEEEALLARAADGQDSPGRYIDPARLPEAYRDIIRTILHLPGRLDHLRRLVALGVEYDRPDAMGVTPVQVAGWEGLPEVMAYLLSLRPDLTHVNRYGGTLLSTILHGSTNCPAAAVRDHAACLELALTHGVALPRAAVEFAGREDLAAFLQDWAEAHPGQVV